MRHVFSDLIELTQEMAEKGPWEKMTVDDMLDSFKDASMVMINLAELNISNLVFAQMCLNAEDPAIRRAMQAELSARVSLFQLNQAEFQKAVQQEGL
jgi:hypothetical protein